MRYRLARPVQGGFDWFSVYDSEENREVFYISGELDRAEETASVVCDKLNGIIDVNSHINITRNSVKFS